MGMQEKREASRDLPFSFVCSFDCLPLCSLCLCGRIRVFAPSLGVKNFHALRDVE